MAYQLPALAITFAAVSAAAGAGFSHQAHLRFIRDCFTCHAGARTSTRPGENLLPRPDVCRPCHEHMTVRSTPASTMLARFNHSSHWKIVPGGCAGCHKVTLDKAALPAMEQCLVCHNKIDPTDSCALCHVVSAALKPATHTGQWGDLHTDPKIDKTGCWVCHGKRFTCQGCH